MTTKVLNPFAKGRTSGSPSKLSSTSQSDPSATSASTFSRSFSRSSLLPKTKRAVLHHHDPQSEAILEATGIVLSLPPLSSDVVSPARIPSAPAQVSSSSAGLKSKKDWRLLWRGGLEIGKVGYRLDGIAFCARISFPTVSLPAPSPSVDVDHGDSSNIPSVNIIDSTPQRPANVSRDPSSVLDSHGKPITATPFLTPSSADTDLCLSLESMRGKKWLRVREVVELSEEDELEGANMGEEGVQVFISPANSILSSWLYDQLLRDAELIGSERTRKAIVVGLGDEGVNSEVNSNVLIYGQLERAARGASSKSMILMASRRKAKSKRENQLPKPGDPLPRALLFPVSAPNRTRGPFPFPRRSGSTSSSAPTVEFSRSRSSSAAPMPPAPSMGPRTNPRSTSNSMEDLGMLDEGHLQSGGRKIHTPGRRGEKRKMTQDQETTTMEQRWRRNGKIKVEADESDENVRDDGFEGDGFDVGLEDFGEEIRGQSSSRPVGDDIFGPASVIWRSGTSEI